MIRRQLLSKHFRWYWPAIFLNLALKPTASCDEQPTTLSTSDDDSIPHIPHQLVDIGNQAEAYFQMGLALLPTQQGEPGPTQAFNAFMHAAELNHPGAQYNLGLIYQSGDGVEQQSYEDALYWFDQAAGQNQPDALNALGNMHAQGLGTGLSYQQAHFYYLQAANLGCPQAHYNLGIMYDNGHGVEQNLEEAFEHYSLAATQNHIAAQFNLASMYDQGSGVSQNLEQAIYWYQQAASNGYARARQRLNSLTRRLLWQRFTALINTLAFYFSCCSAMADHSSH